ncbi:hypothetical protein NPIL_454471, partial [Nephila pilipes]
DVEVVSSLSRENREGKSKVRVEFDSQPWPKYSSLEFAFFL